MPDKNISFIVDEWRFVPNEGTDPVWGYVDHD